MAHPIHVIEAASLWQPTPHEVVPIVLAVLGSPVIVDPVVPASHAGGLDLATRLLGRLGAVAFDAVLGLLVAVEMAWDSWWALVFGFTVTGAVREFVSEDRLRQFLGDDGWREVGYGAIFGASSSSCSFSAVATTRSLFAKGASPAASLGAFQFASTDLVLELGLVVLVLLGWHFVAGEILGGLVAVVVLAVVYRRFVPEEWTERARNRARSLDDAACASCGMAADPTDDETRVREFDGTRRYFCGDGCLAAYDPDGDRETVTAGSDLLSVDRWQRATANAIGEWDMLWRDIAAGFLLAGLLSTLVPATWWAGLFDVTTGWRALDHVVAVVIAVGIGVATFLCSVGNVPFAVVLWENGATFGAVLAFIFADLLILPLVRTYRRYYGTRMAAVIFVAFFLAATIAGLAVQLVFGGLGLVPARSAAGGAVGGTYTAVLNVLAAPLFATQLYVALESHQRERIANRLAPRIAGLLYRGEKAAERLAGYAESRERR